MQLHVEDEIKPFLQNPSNCFEQLMRLRGDRYRLQDGRLTQKITIGNKTYFIKQHFGVGWKEIFKNLLQFKRPIISAMNEVKAIQKCRSLGIKAPRIIGYGTRGINPAKRQSFILLEALIPSQSLEEIYQKKPVFKEKLHHIKTVARIARTLHIEGVNHRDFYLCHFLVKSSKEIFLIDLHRALIHKYPRHRWILKDLVGLFFSSIGFNFSLKDYFRFMKIYKNARLKDILTTERSFWMDVKNRGEKMYCEHQK